MHLDKIRQNLLLKSVQNVCKVIIVFGTNRASISRQAFLIAMFVCGVAPDNIIILNLS